MGIYSKSGRYYFRKQIEGKIYYKALNLRRGQESLLSGRIKQIEERTLASHYGISLEEKKETTLADYVAKYLERNAYKKTWDRDKQRLQKIIAFLGDADLRSIDRGQLEKYERHLLKSVNLKPATTNRYFELLRHLFNQAIEDGYLEQNPTRFYKPFAEEGERRALSSEEITRILKAAGDLQAAPKTRIQRIIYDLILFGLSTGIRLSEILNLKESYVREDMIYYPTTETKSRRRTDARAAGKYRITILNDTALAVINKFKPKAGYVFPMKWRNPNALFYAVHKIRELSGVKDFHFHQLRHTVSTIVANQSGLATAKIFLGHADLKTTMQYTHPALSELRKTVVKLEETISALMPQSKENKSDKQN